MKKSILSLVLAVTLLSSMCMFAPLSASAETKEGICGDNLSYTVNNGVFTISGNGEMYDFFATVNAIVGEKKRPWNGDGIKKVVIEKGVKNIGAYAFYKFEELSEIVINADIESIGDYAFSDCKNLKSIKLPESVKIIGESSFSDCSSLTEIIIPDSTISIQDTAFYRCSSLKKVELGRDLKEIGERAFIYCSQLTSITLHDKIDVICEGAFSNCDLLTDVKYVGNESIIKTLFEENRNTKELVFTRTEGSYGENATWKLENGTLVISGKGKLVWDRINCAILRKINAKNLVIESGITEIYESYFWNNQSFEKVVLPNTLEKLGIYTFRGCKNISEVVFPDKEFEIASGCFEGCINLTHVYLPEKVKLIGMPFGDIAYGNPNRIDITFYTPENSPAYNWAKKCGFKVEVSTREEYNEKNSPSDWALAEVNAAVNEGLVTEKVTKDYRKEITREEFCELVVKLYGKLSGEKITIGNDPFSDTDNAEILKAYSLGIVKGVSDNEFAPENKITRQEICVMFTRCIDVAIDDADITSFETNYFADGNIIAGWAMDSVNYAYTNGIMKGVGDNKVDPLGNTTREQAVLMVVRCFNNYKELIPENPYADVGNTIDFNDDISIFKEETAQEINKSIQSIHTTDEGYVMVLSDDTEFDSLKKDDVFFLEGGNGTPFGEPFIGKIGHITDNGNYLSVNLVEPELNEAFDELSINVSEKIDINDLENIQLAEGLTSSAKMIKKNNEFEVALLSNAAPSAKMAKFTEAPDTSGSSKISIEGTIDLLKLFDLKGHEDTPFTPKVYWLESGEAFHLSRCQYVRDRLYECESCYVTEVYSEENAPGKTPCRKCFPENNHDVQKKEKLSVSESLTLDLSLSLENINPSFVFEYDENGIKTISGGVSGDVEFKTILNTELAGKIKKKTTEKKILGNNLKITGLQEKTLPFFYADFSPTTPFTMGVNMDSFEDIRNWNPLTIAIVGYVDLNGNVSISGSAEFSYKKHVEFSSKIVDNYNLCFSPDFEMSEGEWALPISVSVQGDLNVEEAISAMVYIFNINVAELAIVKLEQNAMVGKASLSCRYGSSGAVPEKFKTDGYLECLLKLCDISVKAKLRYDLLVFSGGVGFSFDWTLFTIEIFKIGVPNDISYDEKVMGVNSCTAYDEKHYYFKDKNGSLMRKSKTNPGDIELIYSDTSGNGGFYSICAIDKSYLYVLKKNGNKYYLNRIAKTAPFTERQILDNVTSVFFQDDQFIYFVDDFSKNTIQKFNRKNLTISDYVTFDDEIIDVSQYRNSKHSQYYVVTYKRDWIMDLFGDYENKCYVINTKGEIIKDFGKADNLDEYLIHEYEDYSIASNLRGNGLTSWYAQDVYMILETGETPKRVDTIGGWRYDDEGVWVINKNDSGESKFVLKIHMSDGEEKEIMPINSEQIFKTIHETTITDYNSAGKKVDRDIVYCIDEIENTWVLYEISNNYKDYKKIKTIPTSVGLANCHICALDDTLYIYSVDEKGKESVLLDTYEY